MFKIKKNPILNKFLDLEAKYKNSDDINDKYSILNKLRLLQGKVLKKITDSSNNTKYNENHKLYKLSLYHSLLEPINSSIKYIEQSIVLANGKYMDIDDDKKNIPKKENKKENKYYNINTNNEISLDDILFNSDFESNYNKLDNIQKMIDDMSELTATDTTTPDENTIDILKNTEKTKKNNIKDIIKHIKLDKVESDANTNLKNIDPTINSDKNSDDEKLENCKSCIVLFYADWCGWSQKFLPIWTEFKNSKDKFDEFKNLSIITINDSEKPEVAKKFNINGFPTIKFLKNDQAIDFNGERTVENLIDFCKKEIKNNKLDDMDINKYIKNGTCIVLFYADWCKWSKNFLPIWDEFVMKKNKNENLKELKEISINNTEYPEYAKQYNINGFPTVKLFKNNKAVDFNDERTVEKLIKFCKKNMNK